MDTTNAIIDKLSERLSKAKYRVRTGQELGAQPISFVASRTKLAFPMVIESIHIVALEQDGAKWRDMKELFKTGFKLGKRINRVPLLRGMQFGYCIIPIIIGNEPDSDLLSNAALVPKRHWALVEFPVVVDLTGFRVAFFEGYDQEGGMFWPMLQKIVTDHIEPIIDECPGSRDGL